MPADNKAKPKDRDNQRSLQRDVQEGFAQIDQGEYEEYDESTIKEVVADIRSRGQKRLAAKRTSGVSGAAL